MQRVGNRQQRLHLFHRPRGRLACHL